MFLEEGHREMEDALRATTSRGGEKRRTPEPLRLAECPCSHCCRGMVVVVASTCGRKRLARIVSISTLATLELVDTDMSFAHQ